MEANTKQVRVLMRKAFAQHNMAPGKGWTEKTSEYNENRRSVVFALCCGRNDGAAILATCAQLFDKAGYSNKLKTTSGGFYLRCIADIA